MENTIELFVRECQIFAGQSAVGEDARNRLRFVREFVQRLPHPRAPFEHLLFKAILCDLALRWCDQLHRQYESSHGCRSRLSSTHLIEYWQRFPTSPVVAFDKWSATLIETFERTHVSAAVRAKRLVDEATVQRFSTPSLARAVGCHPSRLRSSFKLSFGISIREYQTRRQVLQAARLLMSSTEKVDAVARATGFKSRKNFYAAFRRLAGTTPTAIRHWSHSDLESLERRLTLHSDFKNAIT
jgi:AraC-like DNA-binding protein